MSMEWAREKLIEFIKMVGAAPKDRLLKILELFEKFNVDDMNRGMLMYNIREAVMESIAEVFYWRASRTREALHLYDSFINIYIGYYYDIVEKGDIKAFIDFLEDSIRALRSDDEYRETVEDIWIDLKEILKEILGWRIE